MNRHPDKCSYTICCLSFKYYVLLSHIILNHIHCYVPITGFKYSNTIHIPLPNLSLLLLNHFPGRKPKLLDCRFQRLFSNVLTELHSLDPGFISTYYSVNGRLCLVLVVFPNLKCSPLNSPRINLNKIAP